MAFAILRTSKLKSKNKIKNAGGHNSREKKTPNADPDKKNKIIIDGGSDIYQTVMSKIETAGAKYRSNSVLAQEIFLSASPEFFRNDIAQAGMYNLKKMNAWEKESVKWLKENFGNNIVDIKLHLDESTPHIHAIVVPLTQDNRLCAKEIFNPFTLKKYQTSYAKSLKKLGLERGLEGSRAKHTDIKKYYHVVNSAQKMHIPRIKSPELKKILLPGQRKKFTVEVNNNLEKRLRPVFQTAKFVKIGQKETKGYKETALNFRAQNEQLKAMLKAETDKARATPLTIILEKFGLDRDVKDKNQWLGGGHRITLSGSKFFDHANNKGGGGAIDLVKHLNNCNFKEAVAWLGHEINIDAAAAQIRSDAEKITKHAVDTSDLTFHAPAPAPAENESLKKYLMNRGIKCELIDTLIQSGQVYATKYKNYINCCFLCQNSSGVTGAELKGIENKYAGMARGSHRKNGGFCVGSSQSKHIVFVESAIDALSYKQLHDDNALIVSTAGATTPPDYVESLLKNGYKVTVAYDNDETGQQFAEIWKQQYSEIEIEKSFYKDWNEDLQAQAQFVNNQEQEEQEEQELEM